MFVSAHGEAHSQVVFQWIFAVGLVTGWYFGWVVSYFGFQEHDGSGPERAKYNTNE